MKSLAELKAIRDRMQGEVNMREDDSSNHIRVVVGMATCGIASGARRCLTNWLKKFGQSSWTMLLLHRQVVLVYVSMNRL